MSGLVIEKHAILEDSPLTLRDRIIGSDGSPIQQSDVSSIAYQVWDSKDPSTVVASGSLTVASVIYDTLQTTDWTFDNTGYNFAATLAGSCFPTGERIYRVEVAFTMASGGPLYLVKEISTRERWGG